jgi:hypothetical protein
LHRYEAIYEPQQNSYGDERNDELHERHLIFLFRLRKRI